jgi:hypothetical protein
MFRGLIISGVIIFITLNVKNIYPHVLSSSSAVQKPEIHHSLMLETESQYYNDEMNKFDFNGLEPYGNLILDTSASAHESSARRLLPQDMS